MDKKPLTAKDSALTFVLGFALSQIAVLIFTLVGITICTACGINVDKVQQFLNSCLGTFLTILVLDGAMLAVFCFFNKNKQNNIISKPKAGKIFMYLAIGIAAFFCLYPIVACVDKLFVHFGAKLTSIPYALNTKTYLVSLLTYVLIPAVCEELLFRGLIFKGLKNHSNVLAIVLSALMFAIFHMSYQQLVYPILMGLLLGVIMCYENNIIYCIAVHLINNFLSLTTSFLNINLIFNHWAYILLAVVLLLIFLGVVLYFVFKQKNVKQKLDSSCKKYIIMSFAIMLVIWVVVAIVS